MKLGDYLNAINFTKKPLMENDNILMGDESVETDYQPWIINRLLSYHEDTIVLANEMNKYPHLDKKLQFEFYRHAVPKGKRYSKYQRAEIDPNMKLVQEYYNYSPKKAKAALKILTPEQLQYISERLEKGGIKK